jgi:hypothetical protein
LEQTSTGANYLTLRSNGSDRAFIGLENSSGSGLFGGGTAYGLSLGTTGASGIALATNNAVAMTIDTTGRVFTPNQVAFSVYLNSSVTATANTVIPCATELFDIGNNYNTSTYTFTAPVAGKYMLGFTVRYNGYATNVYLHPRFNINGASFAQSHQIFSSPTGSTGQGYASMSWAGVVSLNANDAVTLFDSSQTGVTLGSYQSDQCGFTGYLLG